MSIQDNRITLIYIYDPNIDSPHFYENVRDVYLEFDNDYFILCGDFNLALNPSQDTHDYCIISNPKAQCNVFRNHERFTSY